MSEFKGDPDFPVLLLRRQVAFPRVVVRVLVGRKRSLALLKHLQKAVSLSRPSSPAWRAITALIRGVAQGKVGQKQPTFAAVTVREPEVTSPTPPRAQRRRLSRAVSVQPTGPSPPSPPGTRMPPICRIVCAPGGC